MKNVSIYEKKWLDLVFEGKNKEYGAYKLRNEQDKTTSIAFIFGITFLTGLVFLLSSFSDKNSIKPIVDGEVVVIRTVDLTEPPIIPETKVEPVQPKSNPTTPEEVIPNAPMVVVETRVSQPEIQTNTERPTTPTPPTGTPTGGTEPFSPPSSGTSPVAVVIPSTPSGPIPTSELDRQPNYPGGMKNFYEYVGTNFDRNNLEEGETIRVKVSFVIEKNGTMTDIRVLEKTNATIDNEAIRVLKSLRTKWSPGFKNGVPVRTQFTLPITVVL